MNGKGFLILAGYFGAIGYAFAKTGADRKLAAAFHKEYGRLSQISAKALVDEMTTRKAELASSEN